MDRRLQLHEILCDILGSKNVYFQPPENVKIQYPAILYSRSKIDSKKANNKSYKIDFEYEIIFVNNKYETDHIIDMLSLPTCKHDRHYVMNNLYHDVYTLYF